MKITKSNAIYFRGANFQCFSEVSNAKSLSNINLSSTVMSTPNHAQTSSSIKKYLPYIFAFAGVAFGAVMYAVVKKKFPLTCSDDISNIFNAEKFRFILGKLKPEDYNSSKVFKANLHIHTSASDGKLSPVEVLEQAFKLSKKLPANEKFYFAITDHDSIDSLKVVSDLMKLHPKKYSKLVFVPGLELSVKYMNPQSLKTPMNMDFLLYGFDIDNPKLIEALQKQRNGIIEKTKSVFEDLNQVDSRLNFSIDEMQKTEGYSHLKYIGSNGYRKELEDYIDKRISDLNSVAVIKKDAFLTKYFGHSKYCAEDLMELKDAVGLAKEIDAATVIAHPGKFNFRGFEQSLLKINDIEATNLIFEDFHSYGGDALEYNYQAYREGNVSWWERIRDAYETLDLNLLKSGGYDTHFSDIAKH